MQKILTLDRPAVRAVGHDEVGHAIGRLLVVQSDKGQSRRVAHFLRAWWNGDDLGHYAILHLCNVDAVLAEDMLVILAYLSQNWVPYANRAWLQQPRRNGPGSLQGPFPFTQTVWPSRALAALPAGLAAGAAAGSGKRQ